MKKIISITFFLGFVNIFELIAAQSENEMIKLYFNDLKTRGYNPNIPPEGENGNGPVNVLSSMYLLDIHNVDDFNMEYRASFYFRQSWNDSRLRYVDKDISMITISDTGFIWLPDLFFVEEKEGKKHDIIQSNVFIQIRPDGEIKYSTRLSVTFSCPMDLRSYPHDIQKCAFSIESYGSTRDKLYLMWDSRTTGTVAKTDKINVLSFELTDIEPSAEEISFTSGNYRRLSITLTLKRKFGFFLTRLYIPFIFFIVLSWLSFWIKPKMIALRFGLLLVVLYLMVNTGSEINTYIPPAPYTKASDVWIAVCESLVFATFLEFIFVSIVSKSETKFEKKHYGKTSDPEALIIADSATKEKTMISDGVSFRMVACRLSKSSKLSTCVDKVASITFPFLFLMFNLIYWLIY